MSNLMVQTFEQAAVEALNATNGDLFVYNPAEANYANEYGTKVQLIDFGNYDCYAREQCEANGNGEMTVYEIATAWDNETQILIDYDVDAHNNRFSPFFAVIKQN